jgi:Protein of unknown function (DUF3551)
MHRPVAFAALLAVFIVAAPDGADAFRLWQHQNQPWCAEMHNGLNDCGYRTLAQCRATISGVGGLCQPNLFYYAPEPRPPRYSRRPRK